MCFNRRLVARFDTGTLGLSTYVLLEAGDGLAGLMVVVVVEEAVDVVEVVVVAVVEVEWREVLALLAAFSPALLRLTAAFVVWLSVAVASSEGLVKLRPMFVMSPKA